MRFGKEKSKICPKLHEIKIRQTQLREISVWRQGASIPSSVEEYRHLFRDVPSRTDRIAHGVDIGDRRNTVKLK